MRLLVLVAFCLVAVQSQCPCCSVDNELVRVPLATQCAEYGYTVSDIAPDGAFGCLLGKCTTVQECSTERGTCIAKCLRDFPIDPVGQEACIDSLLIAEPGCNQLYARCVNAFSVCKTTCVSAFNTCYRLIGPGENTNHCVLAYQACIVLP